MFPRSTPFYNNAATNTTTAAALNSLAYATGNLSGDLLFANAAAGDCRIAASSPAIDTATPAWASPTDRLGAARPFFNGYDIGAYEKQTLPVELSTFTLD